MTTQRPTERTTAMPEPRARTEPGRPAPAGRRYPSGLGLSLPGAWGALVMACASLTPSLMPRGAVVQGLVGAVSAAFGYAIGVAVAAVCRAIADRERRSPGPRAWRAFTVVAVPV